MQRRVVSVTLVAIIFLLSARASPQDPPPKLKLGIFNVAIVGLELGLQQTAIDALASASAGLGGFEVVSRNELEAMLGAQKLNDQLGCDDVSCLAEIGAAAGVERVVNSSVAKIDNALVVSLQLINVQYATVENRVTLNWDGPMNKLTDVLGCAANLLLVPARRRQPGTLRVTATPVGAVVVVDGKPQGSGIVSVDGLAAGVHRLRVEAPGFDAIETPIIVRAGQNEHMPVALNALPEAPFYARWWFWAAAALALGGGTTAAVLVARDSGGSSFTDNGNNSDNNGAAPTTASGTFTIPAAPGALSIGGRR